MTPREPVAVAGELAAAMETLAALAAHLRVETEGIDVDPAVRELLATLAAGILGPGPVPEPAARAVVGMTRTLLAQAADLVADPGAPPGWRHTDPAIVEGAGRMSAPIARVILGAAEQLPGLAERLDMPGAVILDVGTGTGWLTIALAEAFPAARVVGIDVLEASLERARANVAASRVADRIELRQEDATALAPGAVYDAIWLPMPFLPRAVVPAVLGASIGALRPGGWVLPGIYGGPEGAQAQLLMDLRTVRSGGHPWRADELIGAMEAAGLADAREIARTWPVPVRLFAARAV